MARKAWIEIEDGLYHVITRGNDRQRIPANPHARLGVKPLLHFLNTLSSPGPEIPFARKTTPPAPANRSPPQANKSLPQTDKSLRERISHSRVAGMVSWSAGIISKFAGMTSELVGMISELAGMISEFPGFISEFAGIIPESPGMIFGRSGIIPGKRRIAQTTPDSTLALLAIRSKFYRQAPSFKERSKHRRK